MAKVVALNLFAFFLYRFCLWFLAIALPTIAIVGRAITLRIKIKKRRKELIPKINNYIIIISHFRGTNNIFDDCKKNCAQ